MKQPPQPIRAIGVIHTPFERLEDCPRQPRLSRARGEIEVFPRFRAGLAGISRYRRIVVVFYFHRSGFQSLVSRPPGARRARGVFATCSPHRPNHLGVSVLRLVSSRRGRLLVAGVDMLNGTPVLDIKPCVE